MNYDDAHGHKMNYSDAHGHKMNYDDAHCQEGDHGHKMNYYDAKKRPEGRPRISSVQTNNQKFFRLVNLCLKNQIN